MSGSGEGQGGTGRGQGVIMKVQEATPLEIVDSKEDIGEFS